MSVRELQISLLERKYLEASLLCTVIAYAIPLSPMPVWSLYALNEKCTCQAKESSYNFLYIPHRRHTLSCSILCSSPWPQPPSDGALLIKLRIRTAGSTSQSNLPKQGHCSRARPESSRLRYSSPAASRDVCLSNAPREGATRFMKKLMMHDQQ